MLLFVPGVTDHTASLAMFCAAAFVTATVVQEFVRGTRVRARGAGEAPPVALVRLVSRNRRRYGGYIVHLGVVIALVGVAASTSFQHQRRATLAPGQSVRSDGYTFTYVKPIAAATAQKLEFGAIMRVSRGGHRVTTLRTVYGVYPSATSNAPLGRFFETNLGASDESTVGLDAGLTHDIWVVISAEHAAAGSDHQPGRRRRSRARWTRSPSCRAASRDRSSPTSSSSATAPCRSSPTGG